MKNLALFDFDGTITKSDTMFKFLRFSAGNGLFFVRMVKLLPVLIAYKIRLITNVHAKEIVLTSFLKNKSEATLIELGNRFTSEKLPQLIREKAINRINWHKQNGDDVYIVSASLNIWLENWCKIQVVNLLSSKIEIQNGVATGKLLGKNCYGIEKVNRIRNAIALEAYTCIYAYGDSKGDKEMLAIANVAAYKPFM